MNDLAHWLDGHVRVMPMLATLAIVIGAFAIGFLLKRPLQESLRQLATRLRLPYGAVLTITRLVISALWIVVAMLVLEIWGVSVGGLWTLLVSAATIIGVGFLATWTMVSNITASFFIAFWRPFRLGDNIEILPENLRGRVIDSNLMFVVVREDGGAVIQIPNNLFFQKMFRVTGNGNKTLFEEYESDTDLVRPTRPDSAISSRPTPGEAT